MPPEYKHANNVTSTPVTLLGHDGLPLHEKGWLRRLGDGAFTKTGSGSADTAYELSHAAVAGQSHHLCGFEVVLRGAVTDADIAITLEDGGTPFWTTYFGTAAAIGERVGAMFPEPIRITANAILSIAAAAGGTGAIFTISYYGYTE
jgi:hypothetical protein